MNEEQALLDFIDDEVEELEAELNRELTEEEFDQLLEDLLA